ncbi:MAG: SIMPL domain-containing protein, partial [Spirochaetota bacterium]
RDEFRDEKGKLVEERHTLVRNIQVQTQNVRLVAEGRADLNSLIAQGVNIENQPPTYHFTKLNDIKPEMLQEATKNARLAANEFATSAGVRVGSIANARQGGFEIRDVGEEYGDTRQIEKNVRVVTSVIFYLAD